MKHLPPHSTYARILALLLTLILSLGTLAACHDDPKVPNESDNTSESDNPSESDTGVGTPPVNDIVFTKGVDNGYTIISNIASSSAVKDAAGYIETHLTSYGYIINSKLDSAGDQIPDDAKEIIVGVTNRPISVEAAEGLANDDYRIVVDGNRIVIVGGSTEATVSAVEYFMTTYINTTLDSFTIPGDLDYKYIRQYPIENLILSGKPVQSMEVVYSSSANDVHKYAARILAETLTELTGIETNHVKDTRASAETLIHVGSTSQNTETCAETEYRFVVDGDDFKIVATDRTVVYAVRQLIASLEAVDPESREFTLATSAEVQHMELKKYPLPSEFDGKMPVALTDQMNNAVVVIDLAASNPTSDDAVLMTFKAIPNKGFATAFNNRVDEFKLRYSEVLGKYVMLACSSKGLVCMAEYPSGNGIWSVGAGSSPHSVEYLPNGLLACALSGGDGYIRIYPYNGGNSYNYNYIQSELGSAHAVHWDDELGVLWALGSSKIVAYEIGGTAAKPTMELIPELGCSGVSGGHDFSPVYGTPGMFWVCGGNAKQFNKYTGSLISVPNAPSGFSEKSLKSISSFEDGTILRTKATDVYASHNTDTLSVYRLDANGKYVKTNYIFSTYSASNPTGSYYRAFYKARALNPNYS